jgi:hypothetical protein
MDTVRHDYNGHVLGFDKLNIDPVATKQRVERELVEAGLTAAVKEAQEAVTGAEDFQTEKAAKVKLSQALAAYRTEYVNLQTRCTMYFQPRAGEVVLPADELAVLRERFAALKPGQKLTLKGEVVNVTESG